MGVEFPSKYALILLQKKTSFIPSCAPNIPYYLLKYPPQKVEYERCDSGSIFVLIPIHGEGISKKKNHLDGISKFLYIFRFRSYLVTNVGRILDAKCGCMNFREA